MEVDALRNIGCQPHGVHHSAGVFASSIVDGTILLAQRDDAGLAHYVRMPSSPNANQAAQHLAHAVAARADEIDDLPGLDDAESVVWLQTERKPQLVSRDTQSGADPACRCRNVDSSRRRNRSRTTPTTKAASMPLEVAVTGSLQLSRSRPGTPPQTDAGPARLCRGPPLLIARKARCTVTSPVGLTNRWQR